jgi:NAD(P)-dependent dehydrogenase (short-subunit alcohol dehydrogenase family)
MVIGGSSGIGLGIVRACLRQRAQVTMVGRSPERLHTARDELRADGAPLTMVADVGVEADVARLLGGLGRVDHVVMTAVDAAYRPVAEFDPEAAGPTVATKLIGPLLVAKHARALPADGSLVFTSGVAAHRPAPGGALVAALNAGLAVLAGALAVELAPLRVNVVSPGWVDTPVWDRIAGPRKEQILTERARGNPAGRLGTPDDVASAVLFLLRSRFITGAVIEVDGGQRWT